jgi:tRNA(Ile)-lysidine synthase
VDAHVPRAERGRIPLVFGPDHLLWIAGHRLDDRVRITPATRHVLALRLEPALDAAPAGGE